VHGEGEVMELPGKVNQPDKKGRSCRQVRSGMTVFFDRYGSCFFAIGFGK
jgi:hypothetical protein